MRKAYIIKNIEVVPEHKQTKDKEEWREKINSYVYQRKRTSIEVLPQKAKEG